MRVLLDENLDWRLKRDLPGREVESVALLGWAGILNGALLRKAVESGFDALVTMDGNMAYQQDLTAHPIAVLVLRAQQPLAGYPPTDARNFAGVAPRTERCAYRHRIKRTG